MVQCRRLTDEIHNFITTIIYNSPTFQKKKETDKKKKKLRNWMPAEHSKMFDIRYKVEHL